jgi:hypothetical protein
MLCLFVGEAVRLIEHSQGFFIARCTGFQNFYVVDDVKKPVMLDNASGCPDKRYGGAPLVVFKSQRQTVPVISDREDIDIPVVAFITAACGAPNP